MTLPLIFQRFYAKYGLAKITPLAQRGRTQPTKTTRSTPTSKKHPLLRLLTRSDFPKVRTREDIKKMLEQLKAGKKPQPIKLGFQKKTVKKGVPIKVERKIVQRFGWTLAKRKEGNRIIGFLVPAIFKVEQIIKKIQLPWGTVTKKKEKVLEKTRQPPTLKPIPLPPRRRLVPLNGNKPPRYLL